MSLLHVSLLDMCLRHARVAFIALILHEIIHARITRLLHLLKELLTLHRRQYIRLSWPRDKPFSTVQKMLLLHSVEGVSVASLLSIMMMLSVAFILLLYKTAIIRQSVAHLPVRALIVRRLLICTYLWLAISSFVNVVLVLLSVGDLDFLEGILDVRVGEEGLNTLNVFVDRMLLKTIMPPLVLLHRLLVNDSITGGLVRAAGLVWIRILLLALLIACG